VALAPELISSSTIAMDALTLVTRLRMQGSNGDFSMPGKYLGTFGNASLFAGADRNCAKRRTSFGMNTYRSNDEANRGSSISPGRVLINPVL